MFRTIFSAASLLVLAVLTSGSSCVNVTGIASVGLDNVPSFYVYAYDHGDGDKAYPDVEIETIGTDRDYAVTGPDGMTRALWAASDAEWVRFHYVFHDREGTMHEGYATADLVRGVIVTHRLRLSSRPPF